MGTTKITSYSQLGPYIDGILQANGEMAGVAGSPHQAFWSTLSYDQFVNGNVPGVTDPNTGQPMPILVKGNSKASNFILALQGAPNTPFDPNTGAFGPMPANGPPYFTAEQIAPIAEWIDAGCPQ